MFGDDARKASKELDLTLTTRDKDKNKPFEEKVPMCGIPYHASDAYIARLIAKGYKVAICEQTQDPATAKGLVDRDIIRVVTPGTVIDAACLEEGRSNFCAGLYLDDTCAGFSVCDISTGKTHVTAFQGPDRAEHLLNELGRFSPAEAVVNPAAYQCGPLLSLLQDKLHCHVERLSAGRFQLQEAERTVRTQFGDEAAGRLPKGNPAAALSLGALLGYLHETQKTDLRHVDDLDYYQQGQFMELDLTARRNLELTETLRSKEKRGACCGCWTRPGPPWAGAAAQLAGAAPAVRYGHHPPQRRRGPAGGPHHGAGGAGPGPVRHRRHGAAGGPHCIRHRRGPGRGSPENAMARLPHVKELLSAFDRGRLGELAQLDTLEDLTDLIGRTLCDDPPFSVREGEFIREGFDPEVDRLRGILHGGKGIIASMEAAEKEKTGIRTLKIGYNKVFGYYIEVSNSFKDQVPETYIRKQTLVNGERYITQELKDLEHDILSASDRVSALEYELFTRLRQELSGHVARIQATAAAVAEADCLCSLAAVAVKNNYCCPAVDESGVIEIHQGRHPVVEAMRPDALFVPNDTYMGRTQDRVSIITGPNMAGKSTYMRQVALMVLMAQIGSFVPAKAARLGIVDRVFTRIGASDDLSAGQSTFMVEMTEVSDILHAATDKSLLILDEIGRGTSTFDGMSIARAVLEYCADPKRLGAKTLFATHYHELTAMEGTLPGVKNYNIAVRARGEEIVFLRKIVPGGADRSYGIEVAKLAGLPDAVVSRARKILRQLEEESGRPAAAPAPREDQVSFAAVAESQVIDRLRRTQVDSLTPLEALQLLYELKRS